MNIERKIRNEAIDFAVWLNENCETEYDCYIYMSDKYYTDDYNDMVDLYEIFLQETVI